MKYFRQTPAEQALSINSSFKQQKNLISNLTLTIWSVKNPHTI